MLKGSVVIFFFFYPSSSRVVEADLTAIGCFLYLDASCQDSLWGRVEEEESSLLFFTASLKQI